MANLNTATSITEVPADSFGAEVTTKTGSQRESRKAVKRDKALMFFRKFFEDPPRVITMDKSGRLDTSQFDDLPQEEWGRGVLLAVEEQTWLLPGNNTFETRVFDVDGNVMDFSTFSDDEISVEGSDGGNDRESREGSERSDSSDNSGSSSDSSSSSSEDSESSDNSGSSSGSSSDSSISVNSIHAIWDQLNKEYKGKRLPWRSEAIETVNEEDPSDAQDETDDE